MTTSTTRELLGFAEKPATFARLVKNVSVKGNDKYVAKIYKDDDEYQVKFFVDGKHQKKADFFTPDLDDAQGTAEYCINDMIRKNMSRPAEFGNTRAINNALPWIRKALEDNGVTIGRVSKWNETEDADVTSKQIGDTKILIQIGDGYWAVQKAVYKDGRISYIQDFKTGRFPDTIDSAIARFVSEYKKLLAANTKKTKKSSNARPEGFDLGDACWKGYEAVGTKKKNGKTVPNCVKK